MISSNKTMWVLVGTAKLVGVQVVSMEILPTEMLPILTTIMLVHPTGMLPILTTIMQVLPTGMLFTLNSMMQGVLALFNLEFVKDQRD